MMDSWSSWESSSQQNLLSTRRHRWMVTQTSVELHAHAWLALQDPRYIESNLCHLCLWAHQWNWSALRQAQMLISQKRWKLNRKLALHLKSLSMRNQNFRSSKKFYRKRKQLWSLLLNSRLLMLPLPHNLQWLNKSLKHHSSTFLTSNLLVKEKRSSTLPQDHHACLKKCSDLPRVRC